jgi:hypothetical protein
MSPRRIVERAREAGLDLISITDHNMTENNIYACEAGRKSMVTVLFGMELQTQEEIHLLVFFDRQETALSFQGLVYDLLPPVQNDVDFFGDQVVVDGRDEIVRFEERLLLNSAQISLGEAVSWVKAHDGLVIPSHIDSPTFSIISQLGYIPDDLPFDALEIRNLAMVDQFLPFIMNRDLPFVTFSDAHYLEDIGRRRMNLQVKEPTCPEIGEAFRALGRRWWERKDSEQGSPPP